MPVDTNNQYCVSEHSENLRISHSKKCFADTGFLGVKQKFIALFLVFAIKLFVACRIYSSNILVILSGEFRFSIAKYALDKYIISLDSVERSL